MRSRLPCRLLHFNLSSRTSRLVEVPEDDQRAFVGGATLGARLLYPHLRQGLDPLSEEAALLFLTGPLTGTSGPAVGRAVFCARSPATRLWGESNIGGHIGPELRSAGLDGLMLTGRAAEPSYLWVHDGQAELRPAGHLWGQTDTYQTQARVREELGDRLVRVASIGLGGEAGLPFASILCDHGRLAGRTGMGAVMGSKQVKAIAVRGRMPIPLARPEAFSAVRHRANIDLRDDNYTRAARLGGTAAILDYADYLGTLPKHYFTRGVLEGASQVSGVTVHETILSGVSTCHGCVVACGRVVRLEDGEKRKGPEYETTVGFGPNLGIVDIAAITRMGEWCDRYGLDSISLSNVIGLAFLLYQEGKLAEADTRGEKLVWGNAAAAERLIHMAVRREGLGEHLARGARALAEHFGAPDLAAEVKNLEVAYHDPRGASGMALVYATSPRGACHEQSDYFMPDMFGQTYEEVGVLFFDRHAGAGKSANVARHQDWRTVCNSLVLCNLANVGPSTVLELVNHATGFDYALDELVATGERGWNLKRAVNHRLGLRRQDDRLPDLFLKPYREGGAAGYVPPFEVMLAAYYEARGWDAVSGRPTIARLRGLGMPDVAADLWGEAGAAN